jgi:hypothetical protein
MNGVQVDATRIDCSVVVGQHMDRVRYERGSSGCNKDCTLVVGQHMNGVQDATGIVLETIRGLGSST